MQVTARKKNTSLDHRMERSDGDGQQTEDLPQTRERLEDRRSQTVEEKRVVMSEISRQAKLTDRR